MWTIYYCIYTINMYKLRAQTFIVISCYSHTLHSTCTCMDATIHTTVCKHIHFIKMALLQQEPADHMTPHNMKDMETEVNNDYFSQILSSSSNPTNTKTHLSAEILRLQQLVQQCMDEDILKTALAQVKATVSVIQSRQKFHNSTLQEKHLYPPNANCERQRKFLSTKKKRGSSVTTMTKPSLEDIARCKNVLKKCEPQRCGVCLQEDKFTTEVIEWIQCTHCGLWLHTSCAKRSTESGFICHFCS